MTTTAPAYPTPGRIVHYMLTAADAEAVNRRREHAVESGIMTQNTGAQVHFGNPAAEGHVLPMMVTRTNMNSINGQVFLDGNDTLWATSTMYGGDEPEPGQWTWPVIR